MEISKPNNKVALFDVCQTLVGVTTITDFTENFLLSSSRNKDFIFKKWLTHYFYKFLRNRTSLIKPGVYRKHFFKLFKGYSEESLKDLAHLYNDHLHGVFKKEIIDKLNELKNNGYRIFILSAGLDVYLKPFAESLGAELVCTNLEKDSKGIFTGNIEGADCVGNGKVTKIENEIPFFGGIDWESSYAFGDSVSDIPTLSLTGHAFVVDPNDDLEKRASENGWNVIKTD